MICKVRIQRRTNTSQPNCANERQQLFIELTTDKFLQLFSASRFPEILLLT